MNNFVFPPSERLKPFVSYFWVSDLENAEQDSLTYYSTADSCPKLAFLFKNEMIRSDMQGQTQTYLQLKHGASAILGVSLLPQAIPYLFGLPTSELNDNMVDLVTLCGQRGKDLNERVATAGNHVQRIKIISAFFEDQIARSYSAHAPIAEAIEHIRMRRGIVNIAELSEQYFLSCKQFERKFREWSGFTPRLFARIVRFETALSGYKKNGSLTKLAHKCGYYDQSHFIHDFREFSGYSPKEYFSLVPEMVCTET